MEKQMLVLSPVCAFRLSATLDCGQCFRWRQNPDGSWHGVALGRRVDVRQTADALYISGDVKPGDEKLWRQYFDLDRAYPEILETLRADDALRQAIDACYGIRILRQPPWETLCSFILSQNNNIPRIKGIIARLCAAFGEPLGGGDFSFPPAERLAACSPESLAPLRAGFRAKYILDAAQKVASGTVDPDCISQMEVNDARAALMNIYGVGEKVADCTLLYGFGFMQVYPVDVWMRRVTQELFPNGLPLCTAGVEGIAQQYLFHWRRNVEKCEKT